MGSPMNHQDRVARNYEDLCIRCLTYDRDMYSVSEFPELCHGCRILKLAVYNPRDLTLQSTLDVLKYYPGIARHHSNYPDHL